MIQFSRFSEFFAFLKLNLKVDSIWRPLKVPTTTHALSHALSPTCVHGEGWRRGKDETEEGGEGGVGGDGEG